MTYGRWLNEKRRELGLTQRDVERRTGVGENALSKIENDRRKPTPETRAEIHRVLNTSEQDLANLGILEEIGTSGRFDWPRDLHSAQDDSHARVTRHTALNQIRDAAGDMQWTQAMVDAIVQQVKTFRSLQGGNE